MVRVVGVVTCSVPAISLPSSLLPTSCPHLAFSLAPSLSLFLPPLPFPRRPLKAVHKGKPWQPNMSATCQGSSSLPRRNSSKWKTCAAWAAAPLSRLSETSSCLYPRTHTRCRLWRFSVLRLGLGLEPRMTLSFSAGCFGVGESLFRS